MILLGAWAVGLCVVFLIATKSLIFMQPLLQKAAAANHRKVQV
jgi:hypothetical protein